MFTTKDADTNLGDEGYELTVTTNGVVIRAATQAGLFYGGETLMQLLPTEIFSTNVVTDMIGRRLVCKSKIGRAFPGAG